MFMQRYPAILKILYPAVAEVVLARNVVNMESIDSYIDKLADNDDTNESMKKWLKGNLRNWLINDSEDATQVKDPPKNFSPDWLLKALERGEKVYDVHVPQPLHNKIQHAMDWFKSGDAPARLDRMTVPEAFKQSNAWTQRLMKKKIDKDATEGEKLIKEYPDGYSWREIASEASCAREGNLMGHCAGGYWNRIERGDVKIWSLRDPDNEPHATIELSPGNNYVRQIKGKGNTAVVEAYHRYVKDLLNDQLKDWSVDSGELTNAGMIQLEDKVYDLEDLKKPELSRKLVTWFLTQHGFPKKDLEQVKSGVPTKDGILLEIDGLDQFLELLECMPDVRTKDTQSLKDLVEQHYDGNASSIKDSDYVIQAMFDYLKEKHPKTFEKLMADIARIDSEQDHDEDTEFDRNRPGKWLNDNQENLENIYGAVEQALQDGESVGTADAAYRYVIEMLDDMKWDDGSYVSADPQGNFSIMVSFKTLTGTSDYPVEPEGDPFDSRGRRGGFDSEYDEVAGNERFYELLRENDYTVD